MSAVLEWLKTFLMLYFFLTLILYLVPKKSYQKYLQFAVKMILLVVVFLPLLNRVSSGVDFFSLVEEFETYKAESGLTDMEGWRDAEWIRRRKERILSGTLWGIGIIF